jgi:putative heme-binding domain-containing protein
MRYRNFGGPSQSRERRRTDALTDCCRTGFSRFVRDLPIQNLPSGNGDFAVDTTKFDGPGRYAMHNMSRSGISFTGCPTLPTLMKHLRSVFIFEYRPTQEHIKSCCHVRSLLASRSPTASKTDVLERRLEGRCVTRSLRRVISTRKLRSIAASIVVALAAPHLAAANPLDQLVTIASDTSDSALRLDVLRGMATAVRGRNDLKAPEGWSALEDKLIASNDEETKRLARNLGLAFGSKRALDALRAIATDTKAVAADRNSALETLLRTRSTTLVPLLQQLVADSAVRANALRGLAGFDDLQTPKVILDSFAKFSATEQRDALNTLASRASYARALVDAVKSGSVPKSALTADLVRQLRSLKDTSLAASLTEIWGLMRETSPDMKAEIDRVKRLYGAGGSQPGDATRGRVVFNQVCAQCHHLFDFGGNVGPDITGANRSDLDYLLQNILFPNAVIPNEYRASMVETKDERVITGVIKTQDANSVSIQTANELVTLPRAEVSKIEATEISMMPEGLLANLGDQQVRDLLYYLSRPGQVPLPSEGK